MFSLTRLRIADPSRLAAAWLHDTIEDTEVAFDALKRAFGEKIASIVLEVTDDKSLPKHERNIRQIEHAASDQFKRNGQVG
jgi:guanosine-3',5'-bis(diphosphate) 3'-pyrophosphohydrolase